MLILNRSQGQTIHIGEHITILIQNIRGKQVCVGIEAPKDIPIRREECSHYLKEGKKLIEINKKE